MSQDRATALQPGGQSETLVTKKKEKKLLKLIVLLIELLKFRGNRMKKGKDFGLPKFRSSKVVSKIQKNLVTRFSLPISNNVLIIHHYS